MAEPGLDVDFLFERYGPMVVRRCRQLLGDREEARDATQDVFVQLLRHRRRLDDRFPSSLLYRIATNICLNRLRERRRAPSLPGDEALERIPVRADLDSPLVLDRLFRRNPESTRVMAVLHYVEGLTLEQVARRCGLSLSGVRKRLRSLRACLRAMEGV
jgi:RNA polymerase sigma-70 factor (ECF subfamily)